MISAITRNVEVVVRTSFLPDSSDTENEKFVFGYEIVINNFSSQTIQLLSRNWLVTDGSGKSHEVKGIGVVGEQPIIAPGRSYSYMSGASFQSVLGKMEGYYTFMNEADGEEFKVFIPPFTLSFPPSLN